MLTRQNLHPTVRCSPGSPRQTARAALNDCPATTVTMLPRGGRVPRPCCHARLAAVTMSSCPCWNGQNLLEFGGPQLLASSRDARSRQIDTVSRTVLKGSVVQTVAAEESRPLLFKCPLLSEFRASKHSVNWELWSAPPAGRLLLGDDLRAQGHGQKRLDSLVAMALCSDSGS